MIQSFLKSPYAICVLIIALILMIIFFFSTIIKLVFRSFFRRIRYSICTLITTALMSLFVGKSVLSPFQFAPDSLVSQRAMTDAVSSFKGIYNSKLPLVAWKFTDVSPKAKTKNASMDALVDQVFDDSTVSKKASADPVLIQVSYFPFGKVLLSYDIRNHSFSLAKGLDETTDSNLLESMYNAVDKNVLQQLPK